MPPSRRRARFIYDGGCKGMSGRAGATSAVPAWQPAGETERYAVIDAIRGAALFGVLMINLLSDFRISLFQHILQFHTDAGWANRLVDNLAAGLLEFKAI